MTVRYSELAEMLSSPIFLEKCCHLCSMRSVWLHRCKCITSTLLRSIAAARQLTEFDIESRTGQVEVFFCLSLHDGTCPVDCRLLLALTGFSRLQASRAMPSSFDACTRYCQAKQVENLPIIRRSHRLSFLQTTGCRSSQRTLLPFGHMDFSTAVAYCLS